MFFLTHTGAATIRGIRGEPGRNGIPGAPGARYV